MLRIQAASKMLAAALWLGLLVASQASAEVRFYPISNLSNNTGLSFNPSLALGPAKSAYVVWNDNTTGVSKTMLSKTADRGKTFSSPLTLSDADGISTFPSVAVDKFGIVHVAWQDAKFSASQIVYTRSLDGGASFSTPANISNDSGVSSHVKLATDSTGIVYAAWSDDNSVHLARSNDSGASFTRVSTFTGSAGNRPSTAQIAIGAADAVHLAWMQGTAPVTVRTARSTDQGVTFSAPLTVASGSQLVYPSIAADRVGAVYIAFVNQSGTADIHLVRSSDGGTTFGEASNITNNSGISINPDLTVDSVGNLHMAWQDTTPGNYESMHAYSTDGGLTFSTPVDIAPSDQGSLIVKVAVDGDGFIYTAWDDNRTGNFDIVVAVGKENLPAVQNTTVTPDPFSPNADGVDDTTRFSASFTHLLQWQLDISNASGLVLQSSRGQANSMSYTWNGTDRKARVLSDGTYNYKISGIASDGIDAIAATGTTTINTLGADVAPAISSYAIDTSRFSPNGDGFKDYAAFDAQFNKTVSWKIEFENSAHTVVRTLSGSGIRLSTTWDGKDSAGRVVSDGGYHAKLTITDSRNATASATKTATIDTVRPSFTTVSIAPLTISPNGDGVDDFATITVNPNETALVTMHVFEASGSLVRELFREIIDPGVRTVVWDGKNSTGSFVASGTYRFKIWCRDLAGNTAEIYPVEIFVTVQ